MAGTPFMITKLGYLKSEKQDAGTHVTATAEEAIANRKKGFYLPVSAVTAYTTIDADQADPSASVARATLRSAEPVFAL